MNKTMFSFMLHLTIPSRYKLCFKHSELLEAIVNEQELYLQVDSLSIFVLFLL
jgi:hypothetical protein